MPSAIAPSVNNYSILKAIASFQLEGSSGYRVLGNCPQAQLSFNIDVLDHFSSMEGIRVKDLSVVRETGATIVLTMDEFDLDNVQMAVLGTDLSGGAIQILGTTEVTGALRIVGQNTVGVKLQWDFPKVQFRPSGNLDLISEEFATMEISGEVLSSGGSFGTVVEI